MTALPNNSVFISYRKNDSAGWSANLARELRTRLGNSAVFIDDSTGIPYGSQWPDQISMALDQCRVFLPVIAPSWHQEENISRLKEPDDWVRQELIAAHQRRHSVLCIPVFVNESPILTINQFSDDSQLQTVIGDLMTNQGIKLDRSTEHWPAKIDQLISLIESHLGISIRAPDGNSEEEVEGNTTTTNGNSIQINGDVQGDVVAGNKIVHSRNPQDVETIQSLTRVTESQQATINKLLSGETDADEQTREAITDAVTGLADIDSEISDIERAEEALANGETELAKALYAADAKKKQEEGQAQLQGASASYRRLGALAFLDDTTAAIEAYENAVELWPEEISAWNQLGHLYLRIGNLDNAIDAYERVGNLAISSDDSKMWTSISLGNLGLVYYAKGDLDRAIELYEQSLPIDEALGRKEGMASVYGNLGIVYQVKGDLDRAIELHEQAMAINQALGRKEGMAIQYGNLGIVYQTRGDLDRAIELHEQALAIDEELGRKEGIASAYGNLGNVYQTKGDLVRAIELYEQALAIDEELGNKQGMASAYGNLGIVYQIKGDLDRAIELHEQALAINQALGGKEGMSNSYGNLGLVYRIKGDVDRARELWKQSAELFDAIGSPNAAKVREWMSELEIE